MDENQKSENQIENKDEKLSQPSKINWSEESLAKLLDYNDETQQSKFVEEKVADKPEGNESNRDTNQNQNIVQTQELFDDPHEGKTQATFAKNPFAKFGAVGLVFLVVFGTGAAFLNTVIYGRLKTPPKVTANNSEEPKVSPKKDVNPTITENGRLKAELALSTQAEKLKAIEDSKNIKKTTVELDSQPKPKSGQEGIQRKQTASTSQVSANRKTPVYQRRASAVRPNVRSVPRYYSPPPRVVPPQTKSPVKPTLRNPALQILPKTLPIRTASLPTSIKQSTNPVKEWKEVNQLGSYGTAEIKENIASINKEQTQIGVKTRRDEEKIPKDIISPTSPVPGSSETDIIAISPDTVNRRNNQITNRDRSLTRRNYNPQSICVSPSSDSSTKSGIDRGNRYCYPSSVKQVKIGSTVSGKLITPMIWGNTSNANVSTRTSNSNNPDKFIVEISKPLRDKDGLIAVPKNSQIVFQIKNIQQSGLVKIQAIQIIIHGQEYPLPANAIAIRGRSGKPLIASKWNKKNRDIAKRDIETFTVGSLAKIGKVLNQPKQEQISTNSSFGTSTFSSTTRSRSNILGAVLSGGFEPLTQQILQRNQRAITKMQQQEEVWFLKAGTDVQVFVNQSFQLSVNK